MQSFDALSGPDKRLRIDYADLDIPTGLTSRRDGNMGGEGSGSMDRSYGSQGSQGGGGGPRSYRDEGPRGPYRDGSMEGGRGRGRGHSGSPGRDGSRDGRSRSRSGSPGGDCDLGSAQNVADICKKTAKAGFSFRHISIGK